jgi:hypothetical protein
MSFNWFLNTRRPEFHFPFASSETTTKRWSQLCRNIRIFSTKRDCLAKPFDRIDAFYNALFCTLYSHRISVYQHFLCIHSRSVYYTLTSNKSVSYFHTFHKSKYSLSRWKVRIFDHTCCGWIESPCDVLNNEASCDGMTHPAIAHYLCNCSTGSLSVWFIKF